MYPSDKKISISRYYPILLINILAFATISYIGLCPFFDSAWGQFKNWYPRWYLLVFPVVKSLFPILSTMLIGNRLIAFIAPKTTWNKPIVIALFICLFLSFLNYGISNTYFFIGILVSLFAIYENRDCIINTFRNTFSFNHRGTFRLIIYCAIILAIGYRLWWGLWAENSGHGDASCRFAIAQIWAAYYLENGSLDLILNPNIDWLPLHFYIVGFIWKFSKSIRLILFIHALIGIASGWFIYKLTQLFSSREVSLLAALGYLVYPEGILMSSNLMSEPFFMLAITSAFYSFIKIAQINTTKHSIFYFLSISAAVLLRYEAWPLVIAIPIIHILWSRFQFHKGLLVHLFVLLAPIAIMSLIFYQGFHPLRGILYSDMQVKYCFDITGRNLHVLFDGYKSAIVPGILAFSALCILLKKRNTDTILYTILATAFTLPFIYKVATYSLVPDPRYLAKYVIIIIPLFTVGFMSILSVSVKIKSLVLNILWSALMLSLITYGHQFINVDGYKLPEGFNRSVSFVNKIQSGSFIVDHHRALRGYTWIALTELPLVLDYQDNYLSQFIDFETVRRSTLKTNKSVKAIKYIVNDYDHEYNTINYELVFHTLKKNNDVYLVLFPEGNLKSYFGFKNKIEKCNGLTFERVFDDHEYQVYKAIKTD